MFITKLRGFLWVCVMVSVRTCIAMATTLTIPISTSINNISITVAMNDYYY